MIFYFGIAFIIAGLCASFNLFRKMSSTNVVVFVKEIRLVFAANDKLKKKQHATNTCTYQSINYEAFILLMKHNVKIGDYVTVAFKEDALNKPIML